MSIKKDNMQPKKNKLSLASVSLFLLLVLSLSLFTACTQTGSTQQINGTNSNASNNVNSTNTTVDPRDELLTQQWRDNLAASKNASKTILTIEHVLKLNATKPAVSVPKVVPATPKSGANASLVVQNKNVIACGDSGPAVCDKLNRTFVNSCYANKVKAIVAYEGECK